MSEAKVNILMPFYNAEMFIKESVDSLLAQTEKNWELIAIDDGSTDASRSILNEYNDPRIKIFSHKINKGLSRSFNYGLKNCSAEYIARMDADDRAHPDRFKKQILFMDKNPSIIVSGTAANKFGDKKGLLLRVETDPEKIRCKLLFSSQLVHPSVIMRTSVMHRERFFYRADYQPGDDYELWTRISKKFCLGNMEDVLLDYRIHSGQTMSTQCHQRGESLKKIHSKLIKEIGLEPTSENLFLHEIIGNINYRNVQNYLVPAEKWLCNIYDANLIGNAYPQKMLKIVLGEMLFSMCYRSANMGIKAWVLWKKSKLCVAPYSNRADYAKWLIKCVLATAGIHKTTCK